MGDETGALVLGGFYAGHDALERRELLFFQFGMRQRLARQHLFAHGGVVDEGSFDGGGLSEIFGLQGLISVHVGVMRAGAVVERILDELKAGNADGVESFVVGSAGVAIGDGGNAEILQIGAVEEFCWR
jgi:hypothetical protein